MTLDRRELKIRQLELERAKAAERLRTPWRQNCKHPWYAWQKEFFHSKSLMIMLTCGNQLGKSTIQLCRIIELCVNAELQAENWPSSPVAKHMIYFYPTADLATTQFHGHWKEYLCPDPDDPDYGYEVDIRQKKIFSLTFRKTGTRLLFMAYSKALLSLSSVTAHYVAFDEEPSPENYQEARSRMIGVLGAMCSFAFTPVVGYPLWIRAMQKRGTKQEAFPKAQKFQVSAYECMEYIDSDMPSPWTTERIQAEIDACPNEATIQQRIFGVFQLSEGLVYECFSRRKNVIDPIPIPDNFLHYVGVDIGSGSAGSSESSAGGGTKGHPAAIVFVAVSPDMRRGYVYKGRRFDDQLTTAGDILNLYLDMKRSGASDEIPVIQCSYDWACRDFATIAERNGVAVVKANKGIKGVEILQTLIKGQMLRFFNIPELEPMYEEFGSFLEGASPKHAKNDFLDSLRYVSAGIPWDFSAIDLRNGKVKPSAKPVKRSLTRWEIEDLKSYGGMDELDGVMLELGFWEDYSQDVMDE